MSFRLYLSQLPQSAQAEALLQYQHLHSWHLADALIQSDSLFLSVHICSLHLQNETSAIATASEATHHNKRCRRKGRGKSRGKEGMELKV